MRIEIDPNSGFCFGVVRAIELAERELAHRPSLLCLGDIVHNEEEVQRLEHLGLRTIYSSELADHRDNAILFRAHGEPPKVYRQAEAQGLSVIDATCPVVLALQRKVKASGARLKPLGGQVMIYGKPDHAEVNGLLGQTDCERVVVHTEEDLGRLDYTRPIECFSQTTMSPAVYAQITGLLRERMQRAMGREEVPLRVNDTTCNRVSTRQESIAQFAMAHDAILFVSGRKSSNGRMLYEACRKVNGQTHFISSPQELDPAWLPGVESLGICGATSTPRWLMEAVVEQVRRIGG
ncbi:MAG: 4-hydroxy-3-methylbut-2-enyl diphosphate reductase [Bacteroidia bacterium]|nr:MAG: 4-hydroxy-3-methylbut-2-enyl diphosphate reductase [Bacteroidia bacterium]